MELPVIEIVPRAPETVDKDASELRDPDIAIFVSTNAVEFGLAHAGTAHIAAIGPATAAALQAAGRDVDIRAAKGYDSEALLATPDFQDVGDKIVRIIRGNGGRELLGNTLRERGASIEYLATYDRQLPQPGESDLRELEQQWREGSVNVVTIMSTESLRNLLAILPEWCRNEFGNTPLVTPATRVIIEAQKLFPGIPAELARGPQASNMIDAIMACSKTQPGQP